jgi:hypothetical protein
LETAELDRDALSQLTLATGGILLPTSNTNELPQRFLQAIAALHRPYYRLVMANLDLAAPWEIVVGGDHAVRLP